MTLDGIAGNVSALGIGCQAGFQLAARRSGVGCGRRMIVFSDGIVTSGSEIMTLRSALVDCEGSGIDVLAIGLGIAPVSLHELFPVCVYTPNPGSLSAALSAALGISPRQPAPIHSRQLYHGVEDTTAEDKLCGFVPGEQYCPELTEAIRNKPISIDFFEAIGDTDLLFMKNPTMKGNPEQEPYCDGAFEGFTILIVCLYMGAREEGNRITKGTFDSQCGASLKNKGFSYTFCCSYGEGLEELIRNEKGRCPYTQLWLFSSDGYGELPREATDRDTNKILPFMRAVQDFWTHGGGLLLFCDNAPFTFDVNYLLNEYLMFPPHEGRSGRSRVRFGGLLFQGQNSQYEGYKGGEQIGVVPENAPDGPLRQSFCRKVDLPPPGQCRRRISLRPGLITFYEGDAISYAVNPSGQPITSDEDLWPFTPFAWTSEDVTPPRPFILFHDPKCLSPDLDSHGPIVLHGGFTSAFYEFGDDQRGTGRLIVSIACWLSRIEERMFIQRQNSSLMPKTVRLLTGNYTRPGESFSGWRQKPVATVKRHGILLLDGSGSMARNYDRLIEAANEYIRIVRENDGLISVVRYSVNASVIYEQETRDLKEMEAFDDRGTDFCVALRLAIRVAERTPPDYECRILFVTDGGASIPVSELAELTRLGIRMDVVEFDDASETTLKKLLTC